MAIGSACLAFALTLATLPTPHPSVIESGIERLSPTLDIANVSINSAGVTSIAYTSTLSNVTVEQTGQLQIAADAAYVAPDATTSAPSAPNETHVPTTTPAQPAQWFRLYMNVTVSTGTAVVATQPLPNSCAADPKQTRVRACTVRPSASLWATFPEEMNPLVKDEIQGALLLLDLALPGLLRQSCGWIASGVENMLTNITERPTTPLDPIPQGPSPCDLRNNQLANMAVNVVEHLPSLLGLRLGLSILSPTVLHAMVVMDGEHSERLDLGGADWIQFPQGTEIQADLDVGNAACPTTNTIIISESLRLFNIRLAGREAQPMFYAFNDVLANAVGAAITAAVRQLVHSDNGEIALTMPSSTGSTAPLYIMGAVAAGATLLGIAAAFASYVAHKKKIVIDKYGNEVGRLRRCGGDAVIIIGCCSGIILFAWSNQTAAAWVRVGGEIDLYSFSLGDSVRDMWDAGLYALSIFIAVFCGFYPYFKLLAILLLSVVLQRPQSVVLQVIDVVGKFSFLDSFVMIIMAEGLTVPGIAEVHMGPSFWVFLGATCLSIAVGNFATHGVRRNAYVDDRHALQLDDFDDGRSHPILSANIYDEPQPRMSASMAAVFGFDVDSPRKFRPLIAGASFVVTAVCLIVPLFVESVTYEMSGPGSLVTGPRNSFTMARLLSKAPKALAALAATTAFAAPALFSAGFARTRVLAAWVTTDVLVVACFAGLLQLKQFTAFVLGSTFSGLITIEATLHWPIYLMLTSAVVSALLTVRSATFRE